MEAAAASWTGRPSIWADPDFQACGRVGGEVGRCCSQSRHLGLPFSSLSPPRQGYRCTWDRGIVGSQATSSAPGLSSPHPTLPLPYFSMTGAREHFRRGGRVPLAWVYQFLPVAPQLLQSLHHYAPASSRGYPLCQESPGPCRLRERRHGPAG